MTASGEPVISLRGVAKRYRLYRRRHQSLKEVLSRRSFGEWDDLWALDDVSFEVPRGQFTGVVGHNGSGKSTLLKVLTGILSPDRGELSVRGRVSSLLELGAGFQPEYTGRENVYLYGALLGLSRREVAARYGSIVEFAELAEFMDHPVKNYSSGMYVRLGFAVAVHLDPEILLVDEVLAVGDASFQAKCFEHLHRLRAAGCTIVLVSHDTGTISRLCERAIWLDHGRVVADGASDQVVRGYADAVAGGASLGGPRLEGADRSGRAVISTVRLLDAPSGSEVRDVRSGRPLYVEIAYEAARDLAGVDVTVTIHRADGIRCADAPVRVDEVRAGGGTLLLEFPSFCLQGGAYDLSVALSQAGERRFHDFRSRFLAFNVHDDHATGAVTWLDYRWSVVPAGRNIGAIPSRRSET